MTSIAAGFKSLLWPLTTLVVGLALVYVVSIYLVDLNKISAATNHANCLMQLKKEEMDQPQICKDIFDSARR